MDASGNLQWEKEFMVGNSDDPHAMVQTSDGGFLVVCHDWNGRVSGYDIWLFKTDASGKPTVGQDLRGRDHDRPGDLIETSDGGFALLGGTKSKGAGHFDAWLLKTVPRATYSGTRPLGGVIRTGGVSPTNR